MVKEHFRKVPACPFASPFSSPFYVLVTSVINDKCVNIFRQGSLQSVFRSIPHYSYVQEIRVGTKL